MLTVTKIQSATSRKNSYYLWDQSGQRGTGRLGVKIFTSGKKQFVCITKERSKNKKDHIVPLNELAFEILQKQYELSGGGRYVFPNPNDANNL